VGVGDSVQVQRARADFEGRDRVAAGVHREQQTSFLDQREASLVASSAALSRRFGGPDLLELAVLEGERDHAIYLGIVAEHEYAVSPQINARSPVSARRLREREHERRRRHRKKDRFFELHFQFSFFGCTTTDGRSKARARGAAPGSGP
jgi:hypothetical protein